jgi:hypothetical protein
MLLTEIITVYCENHTTHISILRGKVHNYLMLQYVVRMFTIEL